jgi:hypothetical protein
MCQLVHSIILDTSDSNNTALREYRTEDDGYLNKIIIL